MTTSDAPISTSGPIRRGESFGLEAYARVMNPFSAGERYLNRVWSASTDGYIDDAHKHMAKARDQFTEALDAYRELRG